MFKQRKVHKTYKAFVWGHPPDQGFIERPIERDQTDRHKMTSLSGFGKEAYTAYKVRSYCSEYSYLDVFPHTGRTHQIRIHLADNGYSLVSDSIYGHMHKDITRHALHAYKLSFTYEGVHYAFIKDIPNDMRHLETTCNNT
jgi:23S rRNA-/tRNA-specific pseudouridylate synthase